MAPAEKAVALPTLVVQPEAYASWLTRCRRYRVRGRVVCRHWRFDGFHLRFCDDPVPGAVVDVFDVDCFWWFCKRDLVGTTTTDIEGNFELEFWWCCPPLLPHFPDVWELDPDLLDRIRKLVEQARPRLPIPIPDPPPDPRELEPYLRSLSAGLQLPGPAISAAQAEAVTYGESALVNLLPAAPDLAARHVWPWWPRRDCEPDLVFRATQLCGGATHVIYEETNAQARWNAPIDLEVTLLANDKACCVPRCEDPDCEECFKFTQVGVTAVSNIGGNNPAAPVAAELLGLASPGSADIAFGRTLRVFGWFGDLADADCYEILSSRDSGPFVPLPKNRQGTIHRQFWGPPCAGGVPQWNDVFVPIETLQDTGSTDHHVYRTRQHFEGTCDPASWGVTRGWGINRDLALVWTTSRPTDAAAADGIDSNPMQDGLYELRVVGYKIDASNKLTDRREMLRCATSQVERLLIRLDNRVVPNHPPSTPTHPWGPGFLHAPTLDPDCDITSLVVNEGGEAPVVINPCDIATLGDTDTLTVHFTVTAPGPDADRHLSEYSMTVHHAESAVFDATATSVGGPQADPTVAVGPKYADTLTPAQGGVRRWWGGGSFKVVLPGSAFPETCAYLFRLRAWKRVFDGSSSIEWFHYNTTEYSITIQKS